MFSLAWLRTIVSRQKIFRHDSCRKVRQRSTSEFRAPKRPRRWDSLDGGWNIFKGTTPYLVHDGVRVSPPRYHLNIDFPDALTGASNTHTILEKCEGLATPSTIAEPPKEEKPSKRARETEQLAVTAATTTAVPGGDLLIVEPATADSEL